MDEPQKKKKSQMGTIRSVAFIIGLLFSVFLAGIYDIRHAFAVDVSFNITIERISAIDDFGDEVPESADFYAKVTIDGNEFSNKDTPSQDALEDDDDISPNWEFSRPIDLARGEIPVTLRIFDEDSYFRGVDDEADIDDGSGRGLELSVPLAPCQVSGDIDAACGTTLVSSGRDNDRATVRFKIDVTEPPGAPGLNVRCLHDPVWPQPGGSLTIRANSVGANSVGGSLIPRTADSIEIWVNSRTGPALVGTQTTNIVHTIGSVSNGTIAYGCRVVDDWVAVFSGWRLTTVGPPQQGFSIPIIFTGPQSNSVDIIFIADKDNYPSATNSGFLSDVRRILDSSYYSETLFLSNQDQINFWIAQDMGDADPDCYLELPLNWLFQGLLAEVGALVHTDYFRDCAKPDLRIFSAWMSPNNIDLRVFLHETGHVPFGLADEYCNKRPGADPSSPCDGGHFQNNPFPNLFEEPDGCSNDPLSIGRTCQEFEEDGFWFFDRDWSVSDPPTNDLMVDNLTPQPHDTRRINWFFDECASARC